MDIFKFFEENCDGTVRKQTINYKCVLSNNDTIIIENLIVNQCDKCGEILFDSAACKRQESEITKKYPNYFKKYSK